MKNLIYVLTFTLVISIGFTSCSKKDPCEGLACLNGGTCEDGTCACPSGYEGSLCETESLPKTINISSIKVTKVPTTKADGSKWDADGTQPDIFPVIYTIKADNKTVDVPFWTSDLIKISASVDLQHDFTLIVPKLSITTVDKSYAIFLFDKDDSNQEVMGSGIIFNLKDLIKGKPATILLDCTGCKVAFELKVSYVF